MNALTRIYSLRKGAEHPPSETVYVGRAMPRRSLKESPFANPFRMKCEGDRQAAIAAFRRYALERLEREPDWLEPLRGKDLVCWCYPLACHADVLIELANRPAVVR